MTHWLAMNAPDEWVLVIIGGVVGSVGGWWAGTQLARSMERRHGDDW